MATAKLIQKVGRRKTASARVRLLSGSGDNLVNGVLASQYFPGIMLEAIYNSPWDKITAEDLHMTAIVNGGGISAQARAVAHGLARALAEMHPEWKSSLRVADLITRDFRMKERRKVGNAHAARAKKSSPKR